MGKGKLILFACVEEAVIIAFIAAACAFNNFVYYIFYNLFYGIIASVSIPILILLKTGNDISDAGVKKLGKRQFIVLFAFVLFSVGGQVIPKLAAGEHLSWSVLPVAIFPLIMTTFFEEFLFRGFIQTRFEKEFGSIAAIAVSGLSFSLYHLGYSGFRTFGDIMLLLAVGIGFAVSFKLSDNNLIVSYFVNLPNAFITYVLKYEQFPKMTAESVIYAVLTIVFLIIAFIILKKKLPLKQ